MAQQGTQFTQSQAQQLQMQQAQLRQAQEAAYLQATGHNQAQNAKWLRAS
jgi:hypothetical protein